MPFAWNANKALIAGNSASGKTQLALYLLRGAPRKLIVDSNWEISTKLGLPYTRDLSQWHPETAPVYSPKKYNVKQLDELIRHARKFHSLTLFIDDIDLFSAGQYYMGDEINNAMINIRHQNIGIIMTMKRIVGIPYLIPQQSNYVYLFAVPALDHDALKQWNRTLSYRGDINDMHRLSLHTFAMFAPVLEKQSVYATDPKEFRGFFKLPKSALSLTVPRGESVKKS